MSRTSRVLNDLPAQGFVLHPLRRFVPGNYDQQASANLVGLADQAAQVHQVLKGNVLQLDFMHENKLLPSDLPAADDLDQHGMLIYLASR